jgi:hypothetical protein
MTELEVEEQGPSKADTIERGGEDVHARTLVRRTIRHNVRTIAT